MNFILRPFIHFILLFAVLALVESFLLLIFFSSTHINSVLVKSLIDTLMLTAIITPLIYFLFIRLFVRKKERTYKTLITNKNLIHQLLETQNELKTNLDAINAASDMIVITDKEGNIDFVNPSFSEVTGYSLEEVRGKNMRILKSGMMDKNFYEAMWNTLLKGKTWSGKIINQKKDKTHYTEEMTITPIFETDGSIRRFVAIKRDVSEREKAQEKLKQMEEQFNQSQKMEAIGRLAGGVAHDFNNLLTGIMGYCELLNNTMKEDSDEKTYLNEVIQSSQSAAELAKQLLIFSKKQQSSKQVQNLNEIIHGTKHLFNQLLGEDIQLDLRLNKDIYPVMADKSHIEQILLNLSVNARDALPQGGRIQIKTDKVELSLEEVQKLDFDLKPGSYTQLTVSDNGVGMPQDVVDHIFEPFYTTKGKGKGIGLGLATVYGTVKQSQGAIQVKSTPNKGTSFSLYFPKSSETAKQAPEPAPKQSRPISDKKETVLIIEDDSFLLYSLVKVLQKNGFHTLISTHAVEAMEVARNFPNAIDLIIMDVVLPRKNGIEVAQMLKEECPAAKILYISGYVDKEIIKTNIIDKGLPFLQKPFNPNKLLESIRDLSKQGPENKAA